MRYVSILLHILNKSWHLNFQASEYSTKPRPRTLWRTFNPSSYPILQVFYDAQSNNWMLVTDYDAEFVDMFDYVDKHGVLSDPDAANVIRQVGVETLIS